MDVGLFGYLIGYIFFNDTAPTEIYTLSLHDALPICRSFPTLIFSFAFATASRCPPRLAASDDSSWSSNEGPLPARNAGGSFPSPPRSCLATPRHEGGAVFEDHGRKEHGLRGFLSAVSGSAIEY